MGRKEEIKLDDLGLCDAQHPQGIFMGRAKIKVYPVCQLPRFHAGAHVASGAFGNLGWNDPLPSSGPAMSHLEWTNKLENRIKRLELAFLTVVAMITGEAKNVTSPEEMDAWNQELANTLEAIQKDL